MRLVAVVVIRPRAQRGGLLVQPSLSTLSETLRAELFTEPEGEYGEIEVEQEYWRRPAGFVGHGWRGA
jgi:hypothetical protein